MRNYECGIRAVVNHSLNTPAFDEALGLKAGSRYTKSTDSSAMCRRITSRLSPENSWFIGGNYRTDERDEPGIAAQQPGNGQWPLSRMFTLAMQAAKRLYQPHIRMIKG